MLKRFCECCGNEIQKNEPFVSIAIEHRVGFVGTIDTEKDLSFDLCVECKKTLLRTILKRGSN